MYAFTHLKKGFYREHGSLKHFKCLDKSHKINIQMFISLEIVVTIAYVRNENCAIFVKTFIIMYVIDNIHVFAGFWYILLSNIAVEILFLLISINYFNMQIFECIERLNSHKKGY